MGRDRRPQVPRDRRPGQPRPWLTRPSTRSPRPGAMHDYFRGNPDGTQPGGVLRAARADPPEYRDRDARIAKHRRVRTASDLAVPHPRHDLRGAAQPRPRVASRSCSAPSTAGSTRTGASTTRTASSPRPTSRWPTSTAPSPSWSGRSTTARATVVLRPAAPTTTSGPDRRPTDPYFDPFWARVNEAGITVVVHAGDSGLPVQRLRDGRVRGGSGAPATHRQVALTSSAPRTTSWPPCLRRVLRPLPACGRSVENGAEFLADLFKKLRRRPHSCRATSPRTRSRSSGATSGSTRSGRTTSTRPSSSWAPTG